MMTTAIHIPVALERTLELVAPSLDDGSGLVVDMTVGLGGHAEALLERFPGIHLLGIDRDPIALEHARTRLARFSERVTLVHARYDELADVLQRQAKGESPRAILLDAGVSSLQIDDVTRGFSYLHDAPLDMRMNPEEEQTAASLLATMDEAELRRLFQRYGDEPLAGRYAKAIVAQRESEPLETTAQLVALIDRSTPGGHPRRGHNAKRVFQALRIAVNEELVSLESALTQALDALSVGGRLIVLSYQSGEDRLVKHAMNSRVTSSWPVDLPVLPPQAEAQYAWVVKGPESASESEISRNPRAASLRLRAIERRSAGGAS